MKEHPQYGTRIPPEELELMRQVAQETSRGPRSRPYGTRPPMAGTGPGPRGVRSREPRPDRERLPGARGPRPAGGALAPRPYRDEGGVTQRTERPHREIPPRGPRKPYRTGVQSAGEGPPRPAPAPEQAPLGRIRGLLMGYQTTAALLAAHSLGIFPLLHQRPQDLGDLARRCGGDPRGMEALLEALVSMGVIHRHGPTYVLPRELAPYLVPGTDGDGTGLLEMSADLYGAWTELARGIREGSPRYRLTSEALLSGDPERVRRYIRSVHTTSRESARRVAELAPLLPGSSLVDVGGGSGIYAAEYARRTPDLKAYLFDLPPTLEIAREILRAEDLEDRVEYTPGDYRHDPFPSPVDTILISNVLQTESEENALTILRRAREALRPGGTLLVHGVLGDSAGPTAAPVALFSLLMYVLFDHGRLLSLEQVSEWLVGEGFGVRSTRPLGPPFHSKLVVATRLE